MKAERITTVHWNVQNHHSNFIFATWAVESPLSSNLFICQARRNFDATAPKFFSSLNIKNYVKYVLNQLICMPQFSSLPIYIQVSEIEFRSPGNLWKTPKKWTQWGIKIRPYKPASII